MRTASAVLLLLAISTQTPAGPGSGVLHLQRDIQISGGDDASQPLTFPGQIAVAADGSIFVTQPEDSRILVYDDRGKSVRVIGREGGGPGEFKSISRIASLGDDLYIADGGNQRLTTLTLRGKTLRTLSVLTHKDGSRPLHDAPQTMLRDGSITALPIPSEWSADSAPLNIYSPRGNFIRTLLQLKTAESFYPVRTARLTTSVMRPDSHGSLYGFIPSDNAALIVDRAGDAQRSTVSIRKITSKGVTLWTRKFSQPPISISRAEINGEINRMAARFYEFRKNIVTKIEAHQIYEEGYKTVRFQAAVDDLVVGQDGTFWLRAGSFGKTSAKWTAYDRNGVARGTIELPGNTRVLMVSANKVWTAEFDEDDVPSIVRYSIK